MPMKFLLTTQTVLGGLATAGIVTGMAATGGGQPPIDARPTNAVQRSAATSASATPQAQCTSVWVGHGAQKNPFTGHPLTNEERESGWVSPPVGYCAREAAASTRGVAPAHSGQPSANQEREPGLVSKPVESAHTASIWLPYGTSKNPYTGEIVTGDDSMGRWASPPHGYTGPTGQKLLGMLKEQRVEWAGELKATATGVAAAPPAAPVNMGGGSPASAPPAVTATPTAAPAVYAAHIANFTSDKLAMKGWNQYRKKLKLASYNPATITVKTPEDGTYTQLVATGFLTKADADAFCGVLAQKGQYCRTTELP